MCIDAQPGGRCFWPLPPAQQPGGDPQVVPSTSDGAGGVTDLQARGIQLHRLPLFLPLRRGGGNRWGLRITFVLAG
ncbi:MAG: hypothetical protein OEW19_05240 [Acidobacteriota bacterium]|nr:hypothetical protein [Acidobacteriota bacterium]